MEIEPLSVADLDQVKRLLGQVNLPYSDLTATHMAHFLGARLQTGELAGIVGLELYGQAGLLRSLVVQDGFRGRGLAGELVQKIQTQARSSGIEELYLLTTTAENYFPRHGFEPFDRDKVPARVGESAEFHSLCPDSAVCMHKVI